jgi:hypothetical protein
MADLFSVLTDGGILAARAERVIIEAKRTKLPLPMACVMLMKESPIFEKGKKTWGGHNIYGHDKGTCSSRKGTHFVTRENYQEYLTCVRNGGKRNGVGPTQLTWWEYQEKADKRGGCWNPDVNITVGFEVLAGHLSGKGVWGAFKAYNGAATYADESLTMLPRWEQLISRADTTIPIGGRRTLRLTNPPMQGADVREMQTLYNVWREGK